MQGLFEEALGDLVHLTLKSDPQYDMDDGTGIRCESRTLERTRSSCQISDGTAQFLYKFKLSVIRQFWASVFIMLSATAQFLFFFLFNANNGVKNAFRIPASAVTWYFKSSAGELVCETLGLLFYISMIFSENNWRRAFVPFLFWNRKSWDH